MGVTHFWVERSRTELCKNTVHLHIYIMQCGTVRFLLHAEQAHFLYHLHLGDLVVFSIIDKICQTTVIVDRPSQSWGFTSHLTASVILGQVLSIVTCGSQTHTEVIACD